MAGHPSHDHGHGHGHDHGHPHQHGPEPAGVRDPAQESLVAALRSGFGVLRVLMVVLVVMYALSGIFRVEPGEQGLIARLGRLQLNTDPDSRYRDTPIFEQGWRVALPDPFDEKIRISGKAQMLEITTFLFARGPEAAGRPISEVVPAREKLTPGLDGAMLTGDKNLSHGLWKIEYRVQDGDQFVLNVGETIARAEPLIQRLAEAAIVREVSSRRVEDVTREALDEVRLAVKSRLQKSLQDLHTGVVVNNVTAETIEPGRVRDAFADVSRAENDKRRLEDEARQRASETLNRAAGQNYRELLERINAYGAAQAAGAGEERLAQLRFEIDRELENARGQVAIRLQEARSDAGLIHERLRREYEQFTYYLAQYRENPVVTALSLWLRMRQDVLGNRDNEVFYVPQTGDITIWTNRDPQRRIDAETARLRQTGQPGEGGQRPR